LLQTFLTVADAGPNLGSSSPASSLTADRYRPHPQVGSQPGNNPVHTLSQWVSITERGAHLRERVQDVFAELEQMLRELDGTRGVNGTLTLAASTTVARYLKSA